MPYEISEERRDQYRRTSLASQARKKNALLHDGSLKPVHPVNAPGFDPAALMPPLPRLGFRALSLFSGGGGIDLGFDLAGFTHVASYEILEICGKTLRNNRPNWNIHCGEAGDVTSVDWHQYADAVDVLHGGPPCQPFSIAGKQQGAEDIRNMWPAFIQAVQIIQPRAFVAENVPGLLDPKFQRFIQETIEAPLQNRYQLFKFVLRAHEFGVPQSRKRVFFVGFRDRRAAAAYTPPAPTHTIDAATHQAELQPCIGARAALGLPEIGFDWLAPTLRSGFTGPRNTTGVINSKASLKLWTELQIWPHGVQSDRSRASLFPPENRHFRLSTQDCALLQGFPASWNFAGAVYQQLGQIGNSVCPPVAYAVAASVAAALSR